MLGTKKIHKQLEELRRADWSTAVSPETRSKGQASNVNFTLTPNILNSDIIVGTVQLGEWRCLDMFQLSLQTQMCQK